MAARTLKGPNGSNLRPQIGPKSAVERKGRLEEKVAGMGIDDLAQAPAGTEPVVPADGRK